MPQTAEKVIDHELLFREPEYQKLFADKKANFEYNHADVRIEEIRNWTKTPEYKHTAAKVERIVDQQWAEQYVAQTYRQMKEEMSQNMKTVETV